MKKNKSKKISFLISQWWKSFEYNYDKPMEKYLWNKKFTKSNFTKDDFTESINNDIDRILKIILYNGDHHDTANKYYTSLNSIAITIYSILSTMTPWLQHLLSVTIIFIITIYICRGWYLTLVSYMQYNTVCFAAIRQYQKYLPSKPMGDAIIKVLNENDRSPFRPVFYFSLKLPIVFGILYFLMYLYNIFIILIRL